MTQGFVKYAIRARPLNPSVVLSHAPTWNGVMVGSAMPMMLERLPQKNINLETHSNTARPFTVRVPLLYPHLSQGGVYSNGALISEADKTEQPQ